METQGLNKYKLRINLTGCSGIGKTTLARDLYEIYHIPFISGSYSDLVPETKGMTHENMIGQDPKTIFAQDVQVLNLRKKSMDKYACMVSDRSYLDSAAYMINKLSHKLPTCEVEDFIEKCRVLTCYQCTHLIYLPYTINHFKEWNIEDNNKRVLNKFYQAEITAIIDYLLMYWGIRITQYGTNTHGVLSLYPPNKGSNENSFTKVLILRETSYEKRLEVVKNFIGKI